MAITNSYADSLERALKMSITKIDQALKVNVQLDAKLQQIGNTIVYKDKFLKLWYVPDGSEMVLSYDMGLNTARYHKLKWLFGGRTKHHPRNLSGD